MTKIFDRELGPYPSNYNTEIDGLRAIAVLAVIIGHYNELALPSGYLGVDMFFVVSGFVISNSLLNRRDRTKREFLIGFYARRIKRLLPVLLLCFVCAGFLISFFDPAPQSSLITGLLSLIGFSNFTLYFNAIDYWGESAKLNPFTHTWSLGVEEQFYFIYPLLLWGVMGQSWGSNRARVLFTALVALVIASLALFILLSNTSPVAAYFLLPTRIWEIGLGCALATYRSYSLRSNAIERAILCIPANVLVLACLLFFFIPKQYSIWATLLIVFCTLLLIHKVSENRLASNDLNSILKFKLIVYIGVLSYSLYLWHWIILSVSLRTIGNTAESIVVQVILISILSVMSFHLLEQPFRSANWKKTRRVKIYFASMLFLLALLVVSMFYFPGKNVFYLGGESTSSKNGNYQVHRSLKCSIEDNNQSQKVMTMGNSHAIHIMPMLNKIARHCNMKILTYKNPKKLDFGHRDYLVIPDGRGPQTEQIKAELRRLDAGDLLILSSRNKYLYTIPYLNAKGEIWLDHSAEKDRLGYGLDNWLKNLDDTIKQARDKEINVVFFLPNVEFFQPIIADEKMCQVEWFRPTPKGCNLKVSRDHLDRRFSNKFYEQVFQRETSFDNFYIFDPLPIYCGSKKWCTRLIDGVVAFRDTNHLTPEGSMLMLSDFSAFLAEKNLIQIK